MLLETARPVAPWVLSRPSWNRRCDRQRRLQGSTGLDRHGRNSLWRRPSFEGQGYATEAAAALVAYAFATPRVAVVRAHTLPTANASTRVLAKCGFGQVGTVVDPEDGTVWGWERTREVST
jgi:RimJ/RimL family protein N-acetyltransferase